MVANFATATLVGFGKRMASSRFASMKPLGLANHTASSQRGGPERSRPRVNRTGGWMHENIRALQWARRNVS
jgi:hypothetical protein